MQTNIHTTKDEIPKHARNNVGKNQYFHIPSTNTPLY